MIEVIALKSHTPDGTKRYKTGEHYRISSAAAKILCALKLVRIAEEVTRSERKRYERRDMRAED